MNEKEARERQGLRHRLFMFLSQEQCSPLCMDDEDDRDRLASLLSDFIYNATPHETDLTQNIIPRAMYRSGLRILDETTKEHIVTLLLERERMMTDGDWLQMQNFLWAAIGRAIRADSDLQQTLRAAGVQVHLDDIFTGGGGEPAAA